MNKPQPTAVFIIIGNEILSGRTKDENLNYLATTLNQIGISLQETRVIPDIIDTIAETVNEIRDKYDYIFTSGGIGPTHDDLTTESIAKAFGVPVTLHPEIDRLLAGEYKKTGHEYNKARKKMASLPEGSGLIANPLTAAPGFIIGNVYVMAGVPPIFKAMVDDIKNSLQTGAPTLSVSIQTNLSEGSIAESLSNTQQKYPQVDIGSYPYFNTEEKGKRSVSIVIRHHDSQLLEEVAREITASIENLGGKAARN